MKHKSRPTAPIRTLLPGEAKVDHDLLDGAVLAIHRAVLESGLRFHLALGRVILDTFFDGDQRAFEAHGRRHASFRALARRPDLPVSHVTLSNAVRLTRQMQLIPQLGRRLNLTQHRALFPLLDRQPELLPGLARRAVDHSLTAAELKRLVDARRAPSNAGRPPLPAFEKTLNLFERFARRGEAFEDLHAIEQMDAESARLLLDKVAVVQSRLEMIEDRLQEATRSPS